MKNSPAFRVVEGGGRGWVREGDRGLFFGVLFGVFFEEAVLDVAGDEFVGGELHGEGGAAACDGAEGGGVGGHLLEGDLGGDFLEAVLA